jgi:hypothetical protein
MGNADRKLLERMAKLTGGKYFSASDPALIPEMNAAIAFKSTPVEPQAKEETGPDVAKTPAVTTPPAVIPPQTQTRVPYRWLAGIVGVFLVATVLLILRRRTKRICDTCGKTLGSGELVCSDCPGQTVIQPVTSLPLQIEKELVESISDVDGSTTNRAPIPIQPPILREPKQETQEILSKTFYLDETPILLVTKGSKTGERYRLSKNSPVSIGRSRLNEIRPEDPSVSAQHCRIVPENGEYVLYDLGSTNGTLVNNIKVNMAVLEEGDTIRIGSIALQFTLQDL